MTCSTHVPDYGPVRQHFWFDWGPVFYRGRLDGTARLLCIASDPGPTERIAGRTLVGDAGQRVQGFLTKLGLTRSYVCLNAFSYALFPSHGQAGKTILAGHDQTTWRNQVFDALKTPHLQAVVAFGTFAQQAVELWPGRAGLTVAKVPHPSSRDATALLDEWRAKIGQLCAGRDTRSGRRRHRARTMGRRSSSSDYAAIPRRDLPFGVPAVAGRRRLGASRHRPVTTTASSRPTPGRPAHADLDRTADLSSDPSRPGRAGHRRGIADTEADAEDRDPGTIERPRRRHVPHERPARPIRRPRPRLPAAAPGPAERSSTGGPHAPPRLRTRAGQSCTGHAVAAVINHVLEARRPAAAGQPVHALPARPPLRRVPGRRRRRLVAARRVQGLVQPRRRARAELAEPRTATRAGPRRPGEPRGRGATARWARSTGSTRSASTTSSRRSPSSPRSRCRRRSTTAGRPRSGHDDAARTRCTSSRTRSAPTPGGHAYCIVGYNEVGFLVQNSWGAGLGQGRLRDAALRGLAGLGLRRVGRPARACPQTPFSPAGPGPPGRPAACSSTGAGPDLRRLALHVVNTGNDGRLSTTGKFVSTPAQVDRDHRAHGPPGTTASSGSSGPTRRHVVIWCARRRRDARASGLEIAQRHLNWWLQQRRLPDHDRLGDRGVRDAVVGDRGPGPRDPARRRPGLRPRWSSSTGSSRAMCRRRLRWGWREMKDNARQASTDPAPAAGHAAPRAAGGRTSAKHGAANIRIHLAGHSAGSVYQASMLERLADAGLEGRDDDLARAGDHRRRVPRAGRPAPRAEQDREAVHAAST